MRLNGLQSSSEAMNMIVYFKTTENNNHVLNVLKDFQIMSKTENKAEIIKIEHEIFTENGAAYILLKSNLNERSRCILPFLC